MAASEIAAAAPRRVRWAPALLAAMLGLGGWNGASLAQTGQSSAILLASQAEGTPIGRVDVVLVRGSGNAARDGAIIARLKTALAGLEGRSFRQTLIEGQLSGPRARMGPGRIDYRLVEAVAAGGLVLRVEVDTVSASPGAPGRIEGILAGGGTAAIPTLYRDGRSYLTTILAGGFGVYSDANPWFGRPDRFTLGSPIARRRPGSQPAWTEGYIEAGIGGATQLGDSPFYAFGAITSMTSWSYGQDIYRDDPRSLTAIEKAYAGLLYVDPETGHSFSLSAGRQNFTLNDGFLIHAVRGSGNVGPRGATYLGPRLANEFSVLADARYGPWAFKAFYIDPSELAAIGSRSIYAGGNLRYAFTPDLSLDVSVIAVPRSTSTYVVPGGGRLRREGLTTLAGHALWKRAFGVEGLWIAGELAHQSHGSFAMSAWAGYGVIGYRAHELPWSPSLSYRYSHATGDNPGTSRYERFDQLLTAGLGDWVQGINFGKITTNANLAVHRLQFNVTPRPELNLTLDWHFLQAPQRNNLGGNPALAQLSSNNIGQEFTVSARWAFSRNFFFQGVASLAVPGKALRDIGATKRWSTFQASLYWTV